MDKPIKTNHKKDLNDYIRKSHITALENFKAELERYKTECDPDGTLCEDPFTLFTLDNIVLVDGNLHYDYNGKPECDRIVLQDEETGDYYEDESLMHTVKFWRKCLNLVRKFWCMDYDKIDAIQNGEAEYHEEEE